MKNLDVTQHQQILDSVPDMVLIKAKGSKIVWANRAFRDFYGMTNEQLADLIDAPFSEPDHTQNYIRDDTRVFESGEPLEIPCELANRHDGVVRMFHTVKSPIRDRSGKVVLTMGISKDITDAQRNEEIIREQQARIIDASKMSALGEMAGGIAHEINNPLAIIQAHSEQLKELLEESARMDPAVPEMLDTIRSTSERIAAIVRGLRNFSRNDSQDPHQILPLRKVIEDTLGICHARFKNHEVDLRWEPPPEDWDLECHPAQISQVILNLLNNAHDAIHGLPEKWIRIESRRIDGRLELSVSDSGPRIPDEIAEKIMNPFFTTKGAGKGTGLGLSISKKIIESHGGTLTLDRSGPRTRFVIGLPSRQEAAMGIAGKKI